MIAWPAGSKCVITYAYGAGCDEIRLGDIVTVSGNISHAVVLRGGEIEYGFFQETDVPTDANTYFPFYYWPVKYMRPIDDGITLEDRLVASIYKAAYDRRKVGEQA